MFNKIQQSSQKASTTKPQKLHLSQGQLFQGRIIKFFPNNIAALQLGNKTVSAKLEAPLSAGQTYWLEVVRAGGIPQLKILDDNSVRRGEQQTQAQVLQQLGIPANKVNDILIRHLATEQIPFTKEVFEKGAQLLLQTETITKEGLQTLTTLLQKNLPLTQESFQAIKAVERSQAPLIQQIAELHSSLQLIEKDNPSLRSYVNGLQNIMKETQMVEGKHPLFHLLHSVSSQGVSQDIREGATQLLQRTGLITGSDSVDKLFELFKAQLIDPTNRASVSKLWPFLLQNGTGGIPIDSMDGKTVFQLLHSRLDQPVNKGDQQQQLQLLLQLFQSKESAKNVTQTLLSMQHSLQHFSSQEKSAIAYMWNQTVSNEQENVRSTIASQFMRIITGVGYLQERELSQFFQGQLSFNEENRGARLKSLLLQLNQLQLSKEMKEKVGLVLHRLTGQQLLAQEQQGPIQQTVLQIPLQLGDWQTEMTVQWEGRKSTNGKIDPDHCRILFYLNLTQLQETIIDVHIQKKVLSVQVFNEHEKPNGLIHALLPLLKKKLSEMGYTLSSIKWVQFQEQKILKANSAQQAYAQRQGYEGVDVRI
ncbi:hypothetical protein [Alkalihalobacterium alkalinitrilicum]|uniref:hypothetical protein n=1 Tax=Alkalihalobacterium alkalinitrilicum TaxID=427920 RepID=UPI000994A947|nr:hypothetical protein [Alkalihalobacterium alkalinitrilicum]